MSRKKKVRIPKPTGKRELISKYQSATQIIRQLRRAELNSRETSRRLVPFFKSQNKRKTCERVWKFLRVHIEYVREPMEDQTAKTINRFLKDRKGDCKHYATTSVGILTACGIPSWFVLVSQKWYRTSPNHAYCCALVDNKIVVIDPCKKTFDNECKHFYKYNYSPRKK